MRKGYCVILSVVVILLLSFGTHNRVVNAEVSSNESINALYQEAIKKGKVNSEKYTFNAFKENYIFAEEEYKIWKRVDI